MSDTNLMAQIEALKAENALLMSQPSATLKVTAKGGVSLYGLGRFPVTLYKSQWLKLLASVDQIDQFLKDNDKLLAVKEK